MTDANAVQCFSSHSGFGWIQFDLLPRPILRVGMARGVANGVEVRCVQWPRLGNVLEVKNDLLGFFAVQAFERFVPCALNCDDARFSFQVSGLQVFTRKHFIPDHFQLLHLRFAAHYGMAQSVAAERTEQAELRAKACSPLRVERSPTKRCCQTVAMAGRQGCPW